MGNQASDARQVKAYNIIKNIPVASQLYRLPRAIIYIAKGNQEQTKRSMEYKVQNINPLKCIGNVCRGVVALKQDLQEGIWIGKRPLGSGWSPFVLNFSPGTDLLHWAVMINGIIYQLNGKDINQICQYQSSTSEKEKQSFHWYVTDLKTPFSRNEIQSAIDQERKQKKKYSLIALANNKTQNCQTFVLNLLYKICKVSEKELLAQIIICADGTWII